MVREDALAANPFDVQCTMTTGVSAAVCDWVETPLGRAVWAAICKEILRLEGARWTLRALPEVAVVGPEGLKNMVAERVWNGAMVAQKVGKVCRYDRVLVGHALEFEPPLTVLHTVAQVLRPDGVAVLVVPHRGGLWAMRERFSPFGMGQPYSFDQLAPLVREAGLEVADKGYALWAPPLAGLWVGRGGRLAPKVWARVMRRVFPPAGGVMVLALRKTMLGGKGLRVEGGAVRVRPVVVPLG